MPKLSPAGSSLGSSISTGEIEDGAVTLPKISDQLKIWYIVWGLL